MKPIIGQMLLVLAAFLSVFAMSNEASATSSKYQTNLKYCDVSEKVLLSPEVQALDLTPQEVWVLNRKMCEPPPPREVVMTAKKPTIIVEPNRVYTGQSAIDVVRQREGELTPEMEHVIIEEGYVLGQYHDVGEIYASGVGQTGKFKGMSFKESFTHHRKRAQRMFPQLDTYSEELRKNIISSTYRGGITGSPKTRALIVSGCYDLAATEFLNNREYRRAKKVGSGVAKRMERLAIALRNEAVLRDTKCGSK